MKFTIIHLSDLHYIENKNEDHDLIYNQLKEDLKSQNPENPHLIFSGDLAYSGASNDSYNALKPRLEETLSTLGITPEKRFFTPGNHDANQNTVHQIAVIQRGILSEMSAERLFNDNLPRLSSQLLLDQKFKNYLDLTSSLSNNLHNQENLSGSGRQLAPDISVYCLNTALCSFAGSKDTQGSTISDYGRLMIDTRSLHKWIATDKSKIRILVMHHPSEWLCEWAKEELNKIINDSFQLVYNGHIHKTQAEQHLTPTGKAIRLTAPALFTKKNEALGYSTTQIDSNTGEILITYRQFAPNNKFVPGTLLTGNETGKFTFNAFQSQTQNTDKPLKSDTSADKTTTISILQSELNETLKCYSNKEGFWIERDLSHVSESDSKRNTTPEISATQFATDPKSCIIRAPKEFGLSALGHFIALEYHKHTQKQKVIIVLNCEDTGLNEKKIAKAIEARIYELKATQEQIDGFILDNWSIDKNGRKTLKLIKDLYKNKIYIALHGVEDCARISDYIEREESDPTEGMKTLYLWALNRTKLRQLVEEYTQSTNELDSEKVTLKLISDLDILNAHRTPLHCLLLLRLFEQAFDDSPVNRTEMIGRVLSLLFFQFDAIPSYATRPDLKDCEFVLGYLCETLIRENRKSFTKKEFSLKLNEFCHNHHIDLDTDILFSFLYSESILISKGSEFEFRFNYWLYYFAAHRMHHDAAFGNFMLSEERYSAFPEILEFYAGITRRCQDAVDILINDLKRMNDEFTQRTGIPEIFNPLASIRWHPSEQALEALKKEVSEDSSMSAVPAAIRDAIADSGYDRVKPYKQELNNFITGASLSKIMLAAKGAGRTLRNSDYVKPESKAALLTEVIKCWCKVAQILGLISPVLANSKHAKYEDTHFMLDHTFDNLDTIEKRWHAIMNGIASNVINWYQDDIFSRKMGPLLMSYSEENHGSLNKLLVIYLLIKQKPNGWNNKIEEFIITEDKNSFYLNRAFSLLIDECKFGENSEKNRQYLRRLSAMALAKHDTGAKHPNQTLVEKVAKQIIDGKAPNTNTAFYNHLN